MTRRRQSDDTGVRGVLRRAARRAALGALVATLWAGSPGTAAADPAPAPPDHAVAAPASGVSRPPLTGADPGSGTLPR